MNYKKNRYAFRQVLFLFALFGVLISCDVKKSNTSPASEYSRIFDYTDMNLSFFPVDLEQTGDGGFLTLSVYTDTTLSTFPLIHLMKTDAFGVKVWESWLDKAYCSAVPSLMLLGNSYYFICMDAVNQESRVMRINQDTHDASEIKALSIQYPLYSMKDRNGDVLVLNFDRLGRKSVLTCYNDEFDDIWSQEFSIIGDVKHQIELHLAKSGKQFPFFIGEVGTPSTTHYSVNCFYNYTMTLLFVEGAAGTQTGTLYSFQENAAVSSAVSIENNRFALTRYYSGDNFVNPSVELELEDMRSITDYPDFSLPELAPDAPVKCLHVEINNKEVVVFASQTRTNQLGLYFYDASNGDLKTVKFLNEKYPVALAGMEYTREEGLALLSQTFVVGRFPRIYLIKLSPEDLEY